MFTTTHLADLSVTEILLAHDWSKITMIYYFIVPVTFVDYYRGDYGSNFQFYFVFLREGLIGDSVIVSLWLLTKNIRKLKFYCADLLYYIIFFVQPVYSRVVRICRVRKEYKFKYFTEVVIF